MQALFRIAAGLVAIGVGCTANGSGGAAGELDCGTVSLAATGALIGAPIPADRLSAIADAMPEAGPSMLDIRQAAEGQGIGLQGIGGTLEEVAGFGGPAIIHLSEPDHFVVLTRLSGDWAQVVDSGAVVAAPRADLGKRYSGHALVLANEAPQDASRVQLGAFHYVFGVSGVGQTVEHVFALSNAGHGPLIVEPTGPQPTLPQITAGPEKDALGYPSLNVLLKTHAGKSYLLAANSARAEVTAHLPVAGGKTVSLPFENREITADAAGFQDAFGPYGVHVYVW